ncbi:ATPase [Novosphingobium sp. FSW06-99]|uniref:F0F1 ATP synthase subunit B family protein n=1 Tax=Novosphingobium sp. FSW06-99 TaxID=1739113 RepID=UPI00076BF061|nr:ATPase [Novosphingobium sp. FSW06-99]KUR74077.1 ATPase [Novosphingobium sp. FSW06-99]
MPQISQLAGTYFSQIFWMLVFFGLTFVIVGRGMVPKVMATMTDRNQTIANDLAAAQAARDAAEADAASWSATEAAQRASAHDLVAEAKHAAAVATQTRLADTAARLETQIHAAEARIVAARAAALDEFEHVAADLAQDIALRVAGLAVSGDDARGAVKGPFAHG